MRFIRIYCTPGSDNLDFGSYFLAVFWKFAPINLSAYTHLSLDERAALLARSSGFNGLLVRLSMNCRNIPSYLLFLGGTHAIERKSISRFIPLLDGMFVNFC